MMKNDVVLSMNAAHEIKNMLQEAADIISSLRGSMLIRHYLLDELRGGYLIMEDAILEARKEANID